jgi:sarcosine oxidase subunit beta
VLATEPLPRRFGPGMALDFGTVYWRQAADGTIVIGGCRDADRASESSLEETVNPVVQRALEEFLPDTFPGFGPVPVARRWAGIMDLSPDGRPVVGRWPGAPGVWVAAGFAGHGLPPASGVGRVVAEAIVLGRDSEWLRRLAPDRDQEAVAA